MGHGLAEGWREAAPAHRDNCSARARVLFGSSEPVQRLVKVNKATGHIDVWPYLRQTLSTSPQNTHSIIRPLKASLDDMHGGRALSLGSVLGRDAGLAP